MKVHANGLQLEYRELGEGEPIVLIMGLGTSMMYWPPGFCELLASRGFRVIMFDNRDSGKSSKIHLRRRLTLARKHGGRRIAVPYTLQDMADDTAALMDALHLDNAHIMGASMGGMIAQSLALSHPEKTRSLTSIMSTPGDLLDLIPHPRMLRALTTVPPWTRSAFIRQQLHFFSVVGSTRETMDEALMRSIAERVYDHGIYARGALRQLLAVLACGSRRDALANVEAPTLVVHGGSDPYLRPRNGLATARAIPNARLEMVPGMGHDLPPRVWPVIADALETLRDAP